MDGTGRLIAGRFRLVARLGAGGMGTVWRARDEVLDTEVAVKEIQIEPTSADAEEERRERIARAMREARAATKLRGHPHVVTVHDVVQDEGLPWIVMELIPCRSLSQVVAAGGPLDVARVVALGRELLDALDAGHAVGVTHRDVKPSNVLIADDGRTVLTDFGIAVHVSDTTLTGPGVIGSPGYVAPERVRGLPATAASDLYGLGATLYYAVEGRPPFVRDNPAALLAAPLLDQPDPPVLAGPLAPLLHRLLEADPQARADAGAARAMLDVLRRGLPPTAPVTRPSAAEWPTRPIAPPPPPKPRRRRLVVAGAALVVMAAVGTAFALAQSGGGGGGAGGGHGTPTGDGPVALDVHLRSGADDPAVAGLISRVRTLDGVRSVVDPRGSRTGRDMLICTDGKRAADVQEQLRGDPAVARVDAWSPSPC